MGIRLCASCQEWYRTDELVNCQCGRDCCPNCIVPMYYEDSAGPEDTAGFICQHCADELVACGYAQDGPAPSWATD